MSSHRSALTLARCSVAAHRPRLRRRGVPALRTPFRRVLAPPAASRPPTAIGRDGNAFLRFAPTLNSAWSFHCARKLACGSPCFIGLTTACFAHCARPSCAPPTAAQCSGASHRPRLRRRGVPALRTPFGRVLAPPAASRPLPAHCVCSRLQPLRDLQRPATGTGMHFYVSHRPALRLRGVPCLRTSCARHFSPSGLHLFASICSRKIPEMTYTPSFLIRTSFSEAF